MNFFRFIREKTELDPHSDLDRILMARLDDEFAKEFKVSPKHAPFAWLTKIEFFRFAPLAAAVVLVAVLGHQMERVSRPVETPLPFILATDSFESSWLDGKEDQIEFYDEMEDWMLTASDDDWDILLEKNG
mgnify:CR=1 FL=1